MRALPPGAILQQMYLKERLGTIPAGRFVEIGPGAGDITAILLDMGWKGSCYDLNADTIVLLRQRFQSNIESGDLDVRQEDFFETEPTNDADLVISCMVMEHFDDSHQRLYLDKADTALNEGGVMICLVPSSPEHWGIEDDIAGHYRRYTRQAIKDLLEQSGWNLTHLSGLTFPVSNCLLPLSNFLVKRNEYEKNQLSMEQRTKLSGNRSVLFKTRFPAIGKVILNELVMYPFHLIQKLFSSSPASLVLYFEATPAQVLQ